MLKDRSNEGAVKRNNTVPRRHPPSRNSSNISTGDRPQNHLALQQTLNRRWLCGLLVGFYLGVTATMWYHTMQAADSQILAKDKDHLHATGMLPPHITGQLVSAANCSEASGTSLKKIQSLRTGMLGAPRRKSVYIQASLPPKEEQRRVREILQSTYDQPFLPLTAVLEPKLKTKKKPLQIRQWEEPLREYQYTQHIQSCHDYPNGWPVGHPKEEDSNFSPIVNIMKPLYPVREEYAEKFCPVDADPFLPWIHDVFPSSDGAFLEVVAHNKRRCRQDPALFQEDIDNLEPQVALLQSVPIKEISQEELKHMKDVPSEWKDASSSGQPMYRLASIEDADVGSKETRFICQFHTLRPSTKEDGTVEKVILGQTLSVYPYNYEHANYQHRKGQRPNPMFTRPRDETDTNGIHNEQIWNAILHFRCPVPEHLQSSVADGSTIESTTGIPSVYVDLVPIRTPPRRGIQGYNPYHLDISAFEPDEEWGTNHVLPPVELSGRWSNVPICYPSFESDQKGVVVKQESTNDEKENYLVGCLWASAAFSIRGEDRLDTSTTDRLLEWLTYHLDVAGFDKIVVYDNTEAFTDLTSLKSVTDLFPGRVTRVKWKHRVCNNNRPTHPNAGERSSQYAAEASCRIRYGPSTEWLMSFDTDEYLVPQGEWTSIRDWLKDSVKSGTIGKNTHILNFYQIRAHLNKRFTERYYDDSGDCKRSCKSCHCLAKRDNATFLEAFCDPVKFPKPEFTARAKKQLYRPAFVLNHFVHYAAVTRLINERPELHRAVGRPYERRVVELTEAFMLHAKTKAPRRTKGWKKVCMEPDQCPVGIPWPHYQGENTTAEEDMRDPDTGFPYNCYEHRKVQDILAAKLHKALDPLMEKWEGPGVGGGAKKEKATTTSEDTAHGDEPDAQELGAVTKFDLSLPAVIATKIQGNSTLLQLEQNLCLLKYAYNDRVNHDIVIFMAMEITDAEKEKIRQTAAPANVFFAMDNPGLETMVAALTPEQRSYLVQRCNVTDASKLTWRTRCYEESSGGYSNMPIQYTWQAEFRSLHLWNHPAIAKYKYMMWLDSDGFCTREWKQDPIATLAHNDLAILFDHFPQGYARGSEWPHKFQEAFGKTICKVDMVDGHLVAQEGNCLGRKVNIKQVHGFFHVTNLDFYRSEAAMKWFRIMVGDTKFSRMFDDQIGVTMPAAVLAGNRSWDMRSHGVNLGVLHSYKLDGQEQFGGFLKYWDNQAEEAFPSAHGQCKITQHG